MVRIAPGVHCDPCLEQLVRALHNSDLPSVPTAHGPGAIRTIASCCGHGKVDGNVILADGRVLIIAPDHASGMAAIEGSATRHDIPTLPERGPWRAEIRRTRFGHAIRIYNNFVDYGPDGGPFWWFGSAARAERKARRVLGHLTQPGESATVITQSDEPGSPR